MKYVDVASINDVPAGTMKPYTVEGKEILLVNYDGQYYAIGKKCTHAGGDLSKGKLEGKIVTCPRHGSKFDITTGSRIAGPAKLNEPTYEAKVDGKSIKINI
jgi:3-phenylpropionate/trans-cinnamate dioxygenase ferredoxin subunit